MEAFNWRDQSEKLWNERAENWNSRSEKMWESGSRKDIIPFFQKYVKKNAKVCDLGCGDGYGSYKLAEAGYEVTGVDVSEEMLERAATVNADGSAKLLKSAMENVPVGNKEFDAVLAINSLEWTESPLMVLKEMKRILKDDGIACIGILGPTAGPRVNSYQRLYGEKVLCNTIMPWELERLAEENGWEKLDEYPVFKKDAGELAKGNLSNELKQALSFMYIFMFKIKY